MYKQIENEVVIYSLNGFEDDAKFIEIDGDKFEVDESDPSKAKVGENGEKIPFKETTPEETPEEKKIREAAEEAAKGGKSLKELAKDNPELQKLLDDKEKREADDIKKQKEAEVAKEEAAKKSGEWKELAEERGQTVEQLKKDLSQKEEILGKYVNSTKTILKDVMATIPKDKQGLVPPTFSPREQLEYISKNAKMLGANVSGKGGGVPPSDDDVYPSEEAKIQAQIDEIKKQEVKTQSDHTKMFELAKKIKDIRAANQGK